MRMDSVYEEDQFKLKDKLTIEQTRKLVATGFKGYKTICRLYNQADETTFDGEMFVYTEDLKPFATVPVRVHTTWGLTDKRFIEDYQGKTVRFGREAEPARAVDFWKEEDMGAVVFTVDEIYNDHDWQNHLALLSLENDMLQPEDF